MCLKNTIMLKLSAFSLKKELFLLQFTKEKEKGRLTNGRGDTSLKDLGFLELFVEISSYPYGP